MRICRFADEDLQMKKCARKKRHRITPQCCCRTIYISALHCVKSAPHSINPHHKSKYAHQYAIIRTKSAPARTVPHQRDLVENAILAVWGLVGPTPPWRFQTKRHRASRKRPADCSRRVLAIGGIIFGARSIGVSPSYDRSKVKFLEIP